MFNLRAKRSRDEFERDYKRAIVNLEHGAPNLKELRIEGQYAHKPDLDSLPEVCQDIEVSLKLGSSYNQVFFTILLTFLISGQRHV